MPFFQNDVGELAGADLPDLSAWESLQQGFDQSYRVDSAGSLQEETHLRWLETVKRIEETTGERFPSLNANATTVYARHLAGEELTLGERLSSGGVSPEGEMLRLSAAEVIPQFENLNKRAKELGLASFEDAVAETISMQHEIEGRSSRVNGISNSIAEFIGLVGGSFTPRDPLLFVTAPVGGFGRSIAIRIATEAAVVGGVEAINQAAFVQPNRERAGLPERDMLTTVLTTAVGAGIIRGGFEGLGVLISRGASNVSDASSRAVTLDFDDAQLRQMLSRAPDNPAARAANDLLDDVIRVERASPYGPSYHGLRRFNAELAEAEIALLGRTDTAIGRVLPEIPLTEIERSADFQILKTEAPETFARLETAQARVIELEDQIDGINRSFDETTLSDAVRLVDPVAAEKLRLLSERVPVNQVERAAIDLEAETILTRVGKEKIAKALNDSEIGPRRQIKSLTASRKAAKREHREAFAAVEAERIKFRKVQDLRRASLQSESIDLLGHAAARSMPLGSMLSREVVEAQAARITRHTEAKLDEILSPRLLDDGTADIGLAAPVSKEFKFLMDDGEELSIEKALRDLEEDGKLDEAMRSCLL